MPSRWGNAGARWSSSCATTATCCSPRRCSRCSRRARRTLEVDALVYDDTAPMLEGHPALSQLHFVGRKWRDAGALSRLTLERHLFKALRARRYDLMVHLSEQPRGAWLARAARRALQRRAGDRRAAARSGRRASRTSIRWSAAAAATRSSSTSTRCGASACSPALAERNVQFRAGRRRPSSAIDGAGRRDPVHPPASRRRAGASSAGRPSATPS